MDELLSYNQSIERKRLKQAQNGQISGFFIVFCGQFIYIDFNLILWREYGRIIQRNARDIPRDPDGTR